MTRAATATSGIWLLATWYLVGLSLPSGPQRLALQYLATDEAWFVLAVVVLWSITGLLAGEFLRLAAAGKALPGWFYLLNGWTVVTLALGLVLPLVPIWQVEAPLAVLVAQVQWFAVFGVVWVVLLEGGRLCCWRLSRSGPLPVLNAATLAVGLFLVVVCVMRMAFDWKTAILAGQFLRSLPILLLAGLVLLLVVDLPSALLQRRRPPAPAGQTVNRERPDPWKARSGPEAPRVR